MFMGLFQLYQLFWIDHCSELNGCFSPTPKAYVETLIPIWWCLEVVPVGGNSVMSMQPSWMGLAPLGKNWLTLFLLYKDISRGCRSAALKRSLTRTWLCWHPDLGLSASRIVRNKCRLSFLVYGICHNSLD